MRFAHALQTLHRLTRQALPPYVSPSKKGILLQFTGHLFYYGQENYLEATTLNPVAVIMTVESLRTIRVVEDLESSSVIVCSTM